MGRWGTSLLDLLCGFLGVMYILIAASSRQEGVAEIAADQPWFSIVGRGTRLPGAPTTPKDLPPALEIHFFPEGDVKKNQFMVRISGQGTPTLFPLSDPGINFTELEMIGEASPESWTPCKNWQELRKRLNEVSAWGSQIEKPSR